jgi:hypothetical protein
MWTTVAGFSVFGLAARFGQLGIQKRPLLSSAPAVHAFVSASHLRADPAGHAIAMATFAGVGYWAAQWDERAGELLAQRRAQIEARRAAAAAASTT